ncbi:hypothetical protein OBBRIDRAFT_770081 [Obba rivulosa]|uniref:non-specific serine/threonine protein kinase n=1 Tax=Obba rivulosa TaxID=1052685 RepID=A0A8E2J4A1_9APHY|nr:hypothetical protein OBBRIDRAFT_770081 [Obba rivulosa]
MLGSAPRSVKFTYGRRAQRFANASENRHSSKSRAPSPEQPLEEPPSSPEVVLVRKVSVQKLKTVAHSSGRSPGIKTKSSRIPVKTKTFVKIKPLTKTADGKAKKLGRAPLGCIPTNAPGSPAVPPKVRKKKPTIGQCTPLKPTLPFVDVDIIVLDDQGRRLSHERRVSRSGVQTNPINMRPGGAASKAAGKGPRKSRASIVADTDEEIQEVLVLKAPKGRSRKRPIVVSSDESESEEEFNTKIPAPDLVQSEKSPASYPLESRSTPEPRRRNVILSPSLSPPPSPSRPASPLPPVLTKAKLGKYGNKSISPSDSAIITEAGPSQEPALPTRQHTTLPIPAIPSLQSLPSWSIPRQLTPIRSRQGRSGLFPAPPTPPSPTTPTDLDLSVDFSGLDLSPSTRAAVERLDLQESLQPAYLQPLLAECSQITPHEFSAFIEMFPLDPIVHALRESVGSVGFQKIGEASYSEVFGIGDVVLKIIPLRDEERHAPREDDPESPALSDAQDVLKEMIVTRAMGEMCEGFVKLLRTYVVRGKYPSLLLDLWDEYNDRKGSESIRPDTFTVSQCYAIIVLPNGGPDLEAYTFESASKTGWRKACSLFWQVTRTLANAEDLVSFEHRDLHWGQILVKNVPVSAQQMRRAGGRKLPMDDVAHGIEATVIDLGLARMNSGDGSGVHWTPLDDEIFEGEGDYQFDVYRMMRAHNKGSWQEYKPLTNVMWLHYLALKLFGAKRLRPPAASKKSAAAPSSIFYTEDECYRCLAEVENLLGSGVATFKPPPKPKKGRRKTQALQEPSVAIPEGPKSATDVLRIAIDRGWILP